MLALAFRAHVQRVCACRFLSYPVDRPQACPSWRAPLPCRQQQGFPSVCRRRGDTDGVDLVPILRLLAKANAHGSKVRARALVFKFNMTASSLEGPCSRTYRRKWATSSPQRPSPRHAIASAGLQHVVHGQLMEFLSGLVAASHPCCVLGPDMVVRSQGAPALPMKSVCRIQLKRETWHRCHYRLRRDLSWPCRRQWRHCFFGCRRKRDAPKDLGGGTPGPMEGKGCAVDGEQEVSRPAITDGDQREFAMEQGWSGLGRCSRPYVCHMEGSKG